MKQLPTVVFLGTPQAAVPTLRSLSRVANVIAVVTQPDRPKGRSKAPVPPPIKIAALEESLEVIQPKTKADLNEALKSLPAVELGVVVAYGMILDEAALAIPRRGMVNVHFSLLPELRGAAPVERAILEGKPETGVSIMQMDKGLDTGDVVRVERVSIEDQNAGELTDALADVGASLLLSVFDDLVEGRVHPQPQDHAGASYARKLTTAEAEVDFSRPTAEVVRHIRAFDPRPGAFAFRGTERFKMAKCHAGDARGDPGQIVETVRGIAIATADGSVEIGTIQPPGKPWMLSSAWVRGQTSLGQFSLRERS